MQWTTAANFSNLSLWRDRVHGQVVQGSAKHFLEQAIYDADTGQLVTGSFTDYAMPRACDVATNIRRLVPLSCCNEIPSASRSRRVGNDRLTRRLSSLAIDDALPASGKGDGRHAAPRRPKSGARASMPRRPRDRALRGTD